MINVYQSYCAQLYIALKYIVDSESNKFSQYGLKIFISEWQMQIQDCKESERLQDEVKNGCHARER